MAAFNDSADPELGAACNRLAAWVEPLPEGAVIDDNSGLTERDLALILRHLYASRHSVMIEELPLNEAARRYGGVSVPKTAKDDR